MEHSEKTSPEHTTLDRVTTLFHLLSAYFFYPAILLIVILDVLGRWLFNHPLAWGLETSCLLLVPAILLVAGEVERSDAHIKLDIIYPRLGRTGRHIVDLLASGFALLWSGAMTIRSALELITSYTSNEGGAITPIPYWPARALFLLAFLLLSLILLGKLATTLQKMLKGESHD